MNVHIIRSTASGAIVHACATEARARQWLADLVVTWDTVGEERAFALAPGQEALGPSAMIQSHHPDGSYQRIHALVPVAYAERVAATTPPDQGLEIIPVEVLL